MHHSFRTLALAALVFLASCVSAQKMPVDVDAETVAIKSVLSDQQDAWNRGDIPAFMEGYWQNADLRFASGGNITYGWQATLDRYLRSYDGASKMGTLSFSDLTVTLADQDDALVFGRWELQREADRPRGLFTLHFRKFGENWLIVSDHTSSGE